jgi:hypothetical protein
MPRSNGFQAPYHPYQILSYIFFAFFEGCFYAVTSPALPDLAFYIVVAVHSVCLAVMIYFVFTTASLDPMDPLPAAARARVSGGGLPDSPNTPIDEKLSWCAFCKAWVDPTSKHWYFIIFSILSSQHP